MLDHSEFISSNYIHFAASESIYQNKYPENIKIAQNIAKKPQKKKQKTSKHENLQYPNDENILNQLTEIYLQLKPKFIEYQQKKRNIQQNGTKISFLTEKMNFIEWRNAIEDYEKKFQLFNCFDVEEMEKNFSVVSLPLSSSIASLSSFDSLIKIENQINDNINTNLNNNNNNINNENDLNDKNKLNGDKNNNNNNNNKNNNNKNNNENNKNNNNTNNNNENEKNKIKEIKVNCEEELQKYFNQICENNSPIERIISFSKKNLFLLPSKSKFLMSDLSQINPLIDQSKREKGYHVIIIDPPWENKSANRSNSYSSFYMKRLFQLPVSSFLLTSPNNNNNNNDNNNNNNIIISNIVNNNLNINGDNIINNDNNNDNDSLNNENNNNILNQEIINKNKNKSDLNDNNIKNDNLNINNNEKEEEDKEDKKEKEEEGEEGEEGTLVIIWITNKMKYHHFVINTLLPLWNLSYLNTWFWLKVFPSSSSYSSFIIIIIIIINIIIIIMYNSIINNFFN